MSLSGLKDTITVTSQFLSHGPAAMCFAAVALAVGLAAAVLAIPAAAGPAQPGPQAPGNAQDLIAALKSRGDQVIINRSGPVKPLSECLATSVLSVGTSTNRFHSVRGRPSVRWTHTSCTSWCSARGLRCAATLVSELARLGGERVDHVVHGGAAEQVLHGQFEVELGLHAPTKLQRLQ